MRDELQQVDRTYVLWKNRRLSYFAGCDYFRLASHPAILKAVGDGLARYGLNVAASRLTTGNHELYTRLEASLADFFAAPAALLVGNGYASNLVVAQALRDDFSHVLIDARSHASLRDATRFFSCPIIDFKHRDPADLKRLLRGKSRPLVVTDGVYSHNGEIAPLKEYARMLPAKGMILVDDAHSGGILGAHGRGTLEHHGISRRRVIQTATLSKAFGVYGGAILCDRPLREKILVGSRMFAGNTPLPLPLANAALAAIELLRDDSYRARLARNTEYVKSALRDAGITVPETPAPIVAIVPRTPRETKRLRAGLLARGVFPSYIQYPGGPEGGYFRFVISSEHSREQLDALLESLNQ
jgi:7-keto-8-aminopelargonate synthetase-like enzyme